jgi:hypothetical protein
MIIKNSATNTKTLNAFISILRCIKTVNTRYDLTDAISRAAATVKDPKLIPETVTVNAVSINRAIHTRI